MKQDKQKNIMRKFTEISTFIGFIGFSLALTGEGEPYAAGTKAIFFATSILCAAIFIVLKIDDEAKEEEKRNKHFNNN